VVGGGLGGLERAQMSCSDNGGKTRID
jgi:hypothetical protein